MVVWHSRLLTVVRLIRCNEKRCGSPPALEKARVDMEHPGAKWLELDDPTTGNVIEFMCASTLDSRCANSD
jgi:hypothetical protein